ncbi:HD domain-containing protein [Aerococcaceae bacterium WGS1372]
MINPNLKEYVQTTIIVQYKDFDNAHQPDHVYQVIDNSLDIANDYEVNLDMVYTIAAYHDLGLKYGRKGHEEASGRMVLEDEVLKEFFNDKQLQTIFEACCDHRASLPYEPRSIYGKIISEADRDVDFDRLLTRAINYSLDYFTDFKPEQTYHQVYEHMKEKYGPNGRVKLWLAYPPNVANLEKVHAILADEEQFKKEFKQLYPILKAR